MPANRDIMGLRAVRLLFQELVEWLFKSIPGDDKVLSRVLPGVVRHPG